MPYTSPIETVPGSATSWPTWTSSAATATAVLPDSPALACQDPDNRDLWFAERGDDVERAKALCGGCPLLDACFEGAVERAEPWGVWGGQVFVEGRVVARKRGRGRPRKDDAQRWSAA